MHIYIKVSYGKILIGLELEKNLSKLTSKKKSAHRLTQTWTIIFRKMTNIRLFENFKSQCHKIVEPDYEL